MLEAKPCLRRRELAADDGDRVPSDVVRRQLRGSGVVRRQLPSRVAQGTMNANDWSVRAEVLPAMSK